ncbi:tetratricopeptide repeat protein [Kiloniella sp.]|uniref:tetratricopeptide repeat protein n=1 Tax=Kiloniella sp. TaxID=1938587 RepID=UPI003B02D25A
MKRLFVLFIFVLTFWSSTSAFSDGFQKGTEAYDRGDYETALKVFKPLAEKGDADAQFNVGLLYLRGQGVTQDYNVAVKWFRLAADQGYTKAQYNMGIAHNRGAGAKKDEKASFHWNKLAAEGGHAGAQFQLAYAYAVGEVVPHDLLRAYIWFSFAAEQGVDNAAGNRDYAVEQMSASQVLEARKMARECKENNYQGC